MRSSRKSRVRSAKCPLDLLVRKSRGNAHYSSDEGGRELWTSVDMRDLADVRNKRGEWPDRAKSGRKGVLSVWFSLLFKVDT